jgi:hypothetical protein
LMTFLKYLQLNWFFWAQIFAYFWPGKYDLHNKIDEAAKFTSQDVLWITWLHQILGETPCISYIEMEETQSLFHKCVMNRGCTKFTMVLWVHPFV